MKKSRPEKVFLGPQFSVLLSVCAAAVMAVRGSMPEAAGVIVISLILGVVASVQIRAHSLFKGPTFTLLAVFMLLQAASVPSLEGTLLAAYAFGSTIVFFLCFMQPQFTRVFFLLFLLTGTAAVFSPQWILWAVVAVALMISVRAFSFRGLVAALLGLLTPFILIPVWGTLLTRSLETVGHILYDYQQPLFLFPPELSPEFVFSAALCVLLSLLTFLTAYGYPAKTRARNLSIFVLSTGAILFPLFTVGGDQFWLPLLNLSTAYHAAHFIATYKRVGWVLALVIWILIIAFIVKQICGF